MLQKQTTPQDTFQLLETLMKDPLLNDFHLAGGTAISLYLGHRISIDLDLFSIKDFNNIELENHLSKKYNFKTDYKTKNTLKGTIEGVKIDCITFNYPLCKEIQTIENVRLYGLPDIIAMKLLAIVDNGTRLKDFIDIAYLSTKYSLEEMIWFAEHKFPNKNPQIYEKALLFHNDILFSEPIHLLEDDFDWKNIENQLLEMVDNRAKIFEKFPLNVGFKNNKKM